MAEEKKSAPKAPKVEVLLSTASLLSVADAAALSPAQKRLILRAAGQVNAAEQKAAEAAAAKQLAEEQAQQSRAARKKRQTAAAGAK